MSSRLKARRAAMFALMNGVAWFEISADRPAAAELFYSTLFGWQFSAAKGARESYRVVTVPGQSIGGGLFAPDGDIPTYAIFGVVVEDVGATCRKAAAAGGEVLMEPKLDPPTGVTFAYLSDPSGNLFGISGPPAVSVDVPLLIAVTTGSESAEAGSAR
jgi:predicted enzyme related to lactoylglutathione lyase